MQHRKWFSRLLVITVCLMSSFTVQGDEALVEGFQSPPQSARPRVWWHWMNGNISKEGIRKDLEWMKRVGIGGMQNFDGSQDTPQVVNKRLVYMTPEWRDAFRYAVELAGKLQLEFGIASSPGWSETGGPWVEPQDGMKKLVWSSTRVMGPSRFNGKLSQPPSVAGPFQDMPRDDGLSQKEAQLLDFYRDIAVLAYRTPVASQRNSRPVKVTTSTASGDAMALLDGNLSTSITLPLSEEIPGWVLYDYGKPRHFRAASLAAPSTLDFTWVLEAGDDEQHLRPMAEWPRNHFIRHATISFPVATARFWRLTIKPSPFKWPFDLSANSPGAVPAQNQVRVNKQVKLNELQIYSGGRVHLFEEKAGFSIPDSYYVLDGALSSPDEAIDPNDIIDLTDMMSIDGSLDWSPPKGDWTVLRLGYSLTGKTNHPASPEATGLEVDKLDKQAVKRYLDNYFAKFEKTLGPDLAKERGLRAFVTDSIESSGQNWTPAMIAEFKARRGYDPTPWLPALTGVIVGDASRSDRFLWDFRKTLMELLSDAHYAQIAESTKQRGLTYYGESLEGYPFMALGDDLDMRQYADIPMAAVWTSYKPDERDGLPTQILDMRGAASVAHIFGQKRVAAESLTSGNEPWAFSPASLRPVIDLAFALGVNLPVIHTSVHQPTERKPGMTLGYFGQHFTRHETWGELATAWITYLSRSSYLLQQGRFAADVAWFYGEEGPLASFRDRTPADLPEGYGFDFVNANILLRHLRSQEGRLVSSGGARYRLLYLGGSSERMTLSVLRRLKELSDQGIVIAGRRPVCSPSLADAANEKEYRQLVAELWDGGKVINSGHPNEVLARLNVARDFDYDKPKSDSLVMFSHRKLTDGHIYFLSNRRARLEQIEARFRVVGKKPELWHADSGKREPVSWRIEQGHTVVPLSLSANESVFVVFLEDTDKTAGQAPVYEEHLVAMLAVDWTLQFQSDLGAPDDVMHTSLGSWTESEDFGVKYFSGVGTYRRTFRLESADLKTCGQILLDLGSVGELAEVNVNGQPVGTVWHAPFRLDVTDKLKSGGNTLEIRVANLWVNRMIGDKQPGAVPVAFTVTSTYQSDAPLRPSGLIGPVTLTRRAPQNCM